MKNLPSVMLEGAVLMTLILWILNKLKKYRKQASHTSKLLKRIGFRVSYMQYITKNLNHKYINQGVIVVTQ